MNVLARAKISSCHLMLPFYLTKSRKCILLVQSISAIRYPSFYSTRATSNNSIKTQPAKKPNPPKSGKSESWFENVKKQAELLTVWPKPTEIPYQAKVANFVNLIGRVKIPVQFQTSSDGKHLAGTVLAQGNSLLIPLVFEGDLAHVVACHVKMNDYVHVSGQLSLEEMPFLMGESLGKCHVVVNNLNFVEGFKSNVSDYARKNAEASVVGEPKPSNVKYDDPFAELGTKKEAVSVGTDHSLSDGDDGKPVKQAWRDALNHADKKSSTRVNRNGVNEESVKKSLKSSSEVSSPAVNGEGNDDESRPEKTTKQKTGFSAAKMKNWDSIWDAWRDLVKNPEQWLDYRERKSKGLVKEKHPDFKHKESGDALWLSNAPKWAMPGLGKLEFDSQVPQAKQSSDAKGFAISRKDSKGEESWNNLIENFDKWWDNRANKRNPKAPDFKHKETGEVLWLNSAPDWVSPRLPPVNGGQNSVAVN